MMLLALIMSAAAPPPPAPSSAGVELRDEGAVKGWARVINCTGSGVTCSLQDAGFGIIDITSSGGGGDGGGAPITAQYWVGAADSTLTAEKNLGALSTGLVINTAGTPSTYAGASCAAGKYAAATSATGGLTCLDIPVLGAVSPLYVDGGYVVCPNASSSSAGCVSTATQQISGYKEFINGGQSDDLWQFTGSYAWNVVTETVNVSQINYQGLTIGSGPIVPTYEDNGVTIQSRKLNSSTGSGVTVQETYFRDAGSIFSVLQGVPCRTQLFGVGPEGNVTWFPAPMPNCADATDILERGVLTHGNTASGAIALQSANERYLAMRGRLAANHSAMLPDGGRPAYDGGRDVRIESDGGTYYAYAGSHGNTVLTVPEPQYGGWLFEVRNNDGFGASKFIIDSYGGIAQVHGMTFAQFPECPGVAISSSLGQFSRGVADGTLLWADDQDHWYVCKSTGWTQLTDSSNGYSTVEDEATPLTQRTTINFTGAGVSCTDSGGKTVCAISGGGGGGSANFVADAFGFTDSSDALKTVTAAWATTSSNIICGPLGEEESVENLHVTVIARASGSFTARGYVPTGRHTGTLNFRCTGD